jgi:U6 snRNA-associated Sm-like protein LSm8
MASYLENLIDFMVNVVTNEGRVFTGILKSFDQSINMIIKDCFEKVYSKDEAVKFASMGLYMIRGDNVMIVSEVDENLEKNIDYKEVKAEKLKEVKTH